MPNTSLTSTEVAALVGKSARTIHRAVAAEEIVPFEKLRGRNGAYLFTQEEAERYRAKVTSAA